MKSNTKKEQLMQTSTSAAKTPARTPSSVPSSQGIDGSDAGLRVTEHGAIDRFMWEANIFYGKGRIDEVRTLAKDSIEKGHDAGHMLQMALMRLEGDKQAFEDAAVEYAVQTGNSPPVWLDAHEIKAIDDSAHKSISLTIQALTSDGIIETTIKMESPWPLTLDFSTLAKIDVMGLDIFHQALCERIKRGEETKLVGIARVLNYITPKLKEATSQSAMSLWEFCLNCYRLTGDRERFNEHAGEYAQRFDAPMPVWKDLSVQDEVPQSTVSTDKKMQPQAFVYEPKESIGEITPALAKDLLLQAGSASLIRTYGKVVVDLVAVRRWSVEEMPLVLDFIRHFAAHKIGIELHNANELLATLMRAFNVDKHARLTVAGDAI